MSGYIRASSSEPLSRASWRAICLIAAIGVIWLMGLMDANAQAQPASGTVQVLDARRALSQQAVKEGDAFLSAGRALKALARYTAAAQADSTNADAFEGLGYAYEGTWNYPKAEIAFQRAVTLKPDNASAHVRLSIVQLRLQLYEQAPRSLSNALTLLQAQVRARPDSAAARFSLGLAYLVFKEWELAEKEQAALAGLDAGTAAKLAAYIAASRKEVAQRQAFLKKVIRIQPRNAKAHYDLGREYLTMKLYAEAQTSFETAIRLKVKNKEVYRFLGMTHVEQNRYEPALAAYQRYAELAPKDGYAFNNLGTTYLRLNRDEEAIAAYQTALKLKPDLAFAHAGLGGAYLSREDALSTKFIKESIAAQYDLARLLQAPPVAAEGYGRYEKALAAFTEAARLMPSLADAYMGEGIVYARTGYDDKAIEALKKAIRYRPDFVSAYMGLGTLAGRNSYNTLAIESFQSAARLQPDSADAPLALGQLYTKLGRYPEAVTSLSLAVGRAPQNAAARYHLALAYIGSRRHELATKQYDTLKTLDNLLAGQLYNALKR